MNRVALFFPFIMIAAFGLFPAALNAQTFAPIASVDFTMPSGGANPLPQILTVASTGTNFNFKFSSSTNSGGSWLKASPAIGCTNTLVVVCTTPHVFTISIAPRGNTLAAGSYTGQIIFTAVNNSSSITVPVTLTVAASGTPFFDNLPGQMSFSLATGQAAATGQELQIRNAGTGKLNWSLQTTTSDGGAWLTASALSGTAPSRISVTVAPANLPFAGAVAGTYVGELTFEAIGSSVSVPVSVVVGNSILSQVNPIGFTKLFAQENPLPQILTITSNGSTNFDFTVVAATATGGAWLSITRITGCSNTNPSFCKTPHEIRATIVAPTLAAGTYTGEIVVVAYPKGSQAITVPVTLTVASGNASFDNLPGQMTFSVITGAGNPQVQSVQVRSAGSQAFSWTLAPDTSDTGAWLHASASSGTTPATVTINIRVANLPNAGRVAGTFTGQLLFKGAGESITIPVTVVVGTTDFVQLPGLSFSKAFGAANPPAQTLTIASTGSAFNFIMTDATGTGGAWLSIARGAGCSNTNPPFCKTPHTITISIVAAPTLPVGTYTGQVVLTSTPGSMDMLVPVTLTVTAAAF